MRYWLKSGGTTERSGERARVEVVPVEYGRLGGFRPHSGRFKSPEPERLPNEPLVSCLCVTENRRAFIPWLLWNFDRQLWRRRELVIVDSSEPPLEPLERKDVRVIHAPLGTSLGKKRNLALEAARGQMVAWFDDDDWQHPKRLSLLVPLLREAARRLGASFVGPSRSFFIDLRAAHCEPYLMHHYAIFNGAVFYTDMVRHARFPEDVLRTEDTRWLATLLRDRQGAALVGEHPSLFMWLSHEVNITNRTLVRRLDLRGDVAVRSAGAAWADTPQRLAELRKRLSEQPAAPPARLAQSKPSRDATSGPNDAPVAPVSAPPPSALPRHQAATRRVASVVTSSPVPVPLRLTRGQLSLVLYALGSGRVGASAVDAIAATAVQRKAEWASADYIGFVWSEAAAIDWDALSVVLERTSPSSPVYSLGAFARATLRQLVARWPNGEELAQHLFVRRLGRPPSLLERVIAVPQRGFVAPRPAFSDYVTRWFVPIRTILDRPDTETRALLGIGDAGRGESPALNHALRAAILGAIAPAAFGAQGRRVERARVG